jgi:hypothetical protein
MVDNDIYVGHLINFTIEFTDPEPQVVTASFNQQVGVVSDTDPIGPDNYGYYCFDNTDVNYQYHPTFDWVPIQTATWSYVTVGDDDVATISLPFPVQYYGETYNSITVCDNGHIAMGDSWWNAWYNAPIPAPQDAAAMIAPFWDDFVQYSMRIYYHYDTINNRFIVGWNNVYSSDSYSYQTFEVIFLDESAWPTVTDDTEIIIQYFDVNNPYSCSVGICSPDRMDGIGYLFNGIYADGAATLADSRALRFTTGSDYVVGVNDPVTVSEEISLSRSYPNPFNSSAVIEFSIPANQQVTIDIYNVLGQKIANIYDGRLLTGNHKVIWNADNHPSGIYFYTLKTEDKSEVNSMTLLK